MSFIKHLIDPKNSWSLYKLKTIIDQNNAFILIYSASELFFAKFQAMETKLFFKMLLKWAIGWYKSHAHNKLKSSKSTKKHFILQPIAVVLSSPHPSYSNARFSNEDDMYSAKVRRQFLSFKVAQSDADSLHQSVPGDRIARSWSNQYNRQVWQGLLQCFSLSASFVIK